MSGMIAESDLATVITFNPTSIDKQTPLAELLHQWAEFDFHHWPVTDEHKRLLGIVALRDLAEATMQSRLILDQATAGEVMVRNVTTISRWDTRRNGLYLLLKKQIHSLPVVDDQRLVGMVTATDFLRDFSFGEQSIARQPVAEFVEETVEPVDCDVSLSDALRALEHTGVEQAGVVNGNLPLGAITRRDLRAALCRVHCQRLFGNRMAFSGPTTVRELAALAPTIRPGARLSEAAAAMVDHHRQAVAVVTQAGRLLGVLSQETLLRAMAGQRSLLRD